jgi:hypothetical protein
MRDRIHPERALRLGAASLRVVPDVEGRVEGRFYLYFDA